MKSDMCKTTFFAIFGFQCKFHSEINLRCNQKSSSPTKESQKPTEKNEMWNKITVNIKDKVRKLYEHAKEYEHRLQLCLSMLVVGATF